MFLISASRSAVNSQKLLGNAKDIFYRPNLYFPHLQTHIRGLKWLIAFTGKSLSEALIFASTNPQYDELLFIELQVQYVKTTSS